MEFFFEQETLTSLQWAFRAVIGYVFLIIIAKLMGQRSISQLRFKDFVIVLLLGNIIAHPLSDPGLGLKGSMISMGVVVLLYLIGIFLSLKWSLFRKWFDPPPIPLIENGQIHYRHLQKARITIDILLAELRKENIEDVQKVALALWEPGGTISIFLDPRFQNVTNKDLGITTEPFYMPRTIIKDRKIDYNELKLSGKDEEWVKKKLENVHKVGIKDILLAVIDHEDNLKILLHR
jgi:uncharacterized membrane protein YcaP (DUF421 family)